MQPRPSSGFDPVHYKQTTGQQWDIAGEAWHEIAEVHRAFEDERSFSSPCELVAGPLRREQGILFAEVDANRAAGARRSLDTVAHYARPDIFQLRVDRRPQPPVAWS